jgi:O-acetyl-ADP-ribose deacetylase (regulator of RNase III)
LISEVFLDVWRQPGKFDGRSTASTWMLSIARFKAVATPAGSSGVGSFALIRFAPQASSDDITKFLEANKLSIAAGPMAGGLYKVRVVSSISATD